MEDTIQEKEHLNNFVGGYLARMENGPQIPVYRHIGRPNAGPMMRHKWVLLFRSENDVTLSKALEIFNSRVFKGYLVPVIEGITDEQWETNLTHH